MFFVEQLAVLLFSRLAAFKMQEDAFIYCA